MAFLAMAPIAVFPRLAGVDGVCDGETNKTLGTSPPRRGGANGRGPAARWRAACRAPRRSSRLGCQVARNGEPYDLAGFAAPFLGRCLHLLSHLFRERYRRRDRRFSPLLLAPGVQSAFVQLHGFDAAALVVDLVARCWWAQRLVVPPLRDGPRSSPFFVSALFSGRSCRRFTARVIDPPRAVAGP